MQYGSGRTAVAAVTMGVIGIATASCSTMLKSDGATFRAKSDAASEPETLAVSTHVNAMSPIHWGIFGYKTAAADDEFVVSAPYGGIDAVRSGLVTRFERSSGRWKGSLLAVPDVNDHDGIYPTKKLPPPIPPLADDWPATNVAMNGKYIIESRCGEDRGREGVGSAPDSGAVYVHDRTAIEAEPQYLKAPNADEDDAFGAGLAVSGERLAIGAFGEDSANADLADNSAKDSGAVYIYTARDGRFVHEAFVKAPTPTPGAMFGQSVALDGDWLVVGAPNTAGPPSGAAVSQPARGAAFVYRRSGDGQWSLEDEAVPGTSSQLEFYGSAVGVSEGTVAIGAPGAPNCGRPGEVETANQGAVFVRTKHDGVWSESCLEPDVAGFALFGFSLALSGVRLVVGAPFEAPDLGGSVYVFERDAAGVWRRTLHLRSSTKKHTDLFGNSVSIGNGFLVLGSPHDSDSESDMGAEMDDGGSKWAGAAFLFEMPAD